MGPIKKVFAKRLKPKFLASPAPNPQVEVGSQLIMGLPMITIAIMTPFNGGGTQTPPGSQDHNRVRTIVIIDNTDSRCNQPTPGMPVKTLANLECRVDKS